MGSVVMVWSMQMIAQSPWSGGRSPPEAENFLASRCATEAANLPHSPQFANSVNPRHSRYIFQKTERVVHDGMDNVVYDKVYQKCKLLIQLTTVTKETGRVVAAEAI